MSSSAPSNTSDDTVVVVAQLTSDDFRRSLQRFVEENKPDPISKRQIESLALEWIQAEGRNKEGGDNTLMLQQPLSGASHILKGKLKIHGTYMEVVLDMECSWKSSLESPSKPNASNNDTDNDLSNQKYGTLYYRCRVDSSTFVPPSSSSMEESSNGTKDDKKHDKSQRRIHEKMVKRLKEDSYISKYLIKTDADTDNGEGEDISVLANARIHNVKGAVGDGNDDSTGGNNDDDKKSPEIDLDSMIAQIYADAAEKNDDGTKRGEGDRNSSSTNKNTRIAQLEERVDVSEQVAEAVRRAIWSSSESSLDVVEFILYMPSLPTMNHKTNTCTPLADRAKLRMLEDAMLDACEREGEDGLLEDLSITNKNAEASEGSKRGKKSKTQR